jgi:protein associated with RNAse G/E
LTDITIRKLDHRGCETWRYTGVVLERDATWVRLQAYFNRSNTDAGYVVFRQGDRFIERFYSDRWYNLFEIHDVRDDHLKGWYCNLARPATITADEISCEDLALDVWIDPAGQITLLDEEEFEALPLDAREHYRVSQAVEEVRAQVERREPPFNVIPR